MELAQHARDVIPHLKQIDKGYPLFWYNSDKVKGFRLTQRGFDTMIDIGYVSYTFKIYKLTTNNIIKMDQKIFHPWFLLGLSTFRIFYEPMVIAMALSDNNIDKAIDLTYI
jgi:hypothetical protein